MDAGAAAPEVVGGVFLQLDFVVLAKFFLPHLLDALHVRELLYESRNLLAGQCDQIVQRLGSAGSGNREKSNGGGRNRDPPKIHAME